MKPNLVKITCHGVLGEYLKCSTWNIAAKTLSNCLNAIETLSKRKLYRFLLDSEKRGIKYNVLINGRDFTYEKLPTINDIDSIKNSELCMKIEDLKTVDIIPVIEGAGGDFLDIFTIILGVVLVVVGIVLIATPFGVPLIIAGLGLIAAGVINLLTKPPELEELKSRQKTSSLFSGPTNTSQEGQNVPIHYGLSMIGSAVISASYDIEQFHVGHTSSEYVS